MKKRVTQFFVDSFLRSQEKLVLKLLENGRLSKEDFLGTREEFYELADEYENGEIDGNEFFRKNRKIESSFSDNISGKRTGVSREEALKLYTPLKERERDVSVGAYLDSSKSPYLLMLRLPLIKVLFGFLRLRYR